MCGFNVISLPSDERGRVSLAEIRKVIGPDTAVCMMTNPNTLGLFEDQIAEITAAVHAAGGLMYYDGANANALMGNTRPGDMGFDLMHLNTHKTFTIPHGGGGAGHGPLGVAAHLVAYLPTPVVVASADGVAERRLSSLDFDRPKSIGPMRSFWSNFAHAVRALAYLYANGEEGLQRVSQLPVLNANYLRVKIAEFLETPYPENLPSRVRRLGATAQAGDRRPRAGRGKSTARPRLHGADDVLPAHRARVLDDRADRDRIEGDPRRIRRGAARDRCDREIEPRSAVEAPVTTVVGRVDETRAARQPDLRWTPAPN